MHVAFVCPGMPFNGDFVERGASLGGSETACYYVAREMAALGHKVVVFTNDETAGGKFHGVDYAWCGPPSERWPLGEFVQNFMETTYVDALILQRASAIHRVPHAAKVALWWLHDLALLRALPGVRQDSFHYDGILAVSEWHRSQVSETWHVPKDFIGVVRNSVDLKLYDRSAGGPIRDEAKTELRLLYQSRPERGIDYLIAPGAIMDQLAERRPEAKLYVCGYDNYPEHMRQYYDQVYGRCRAMPNVEVVGHLGKAELAAFQRSCDVLVYPGEFEETSCITAMEAQAAGLPMIASKTGALSETCGPGARLVPLRDDRCNVLAFVEFLHRTKPADLERMRRQQLEIARERLGWQKSAAALDAIIGEAFRKKQSNPFSVARSMLDTSDVLLARHTFFSNAKRTSVEPELKELAAEFDFLNRENGMREHYDSDAAVSDIEKNVSLDVRENLRFQQVQEQLMGADVEPTRVLDFGCQKGHYIWSLAQMNPQVEYVGVDVSPRVVAWASEHCKVEGVKIEFLSGETLADGDVAGSLRPVDALLLGEILEHVESPLKLLEELEPRLADECRVVITTPFGDWEGKDFRSTPGLPRYHVHHFERADLDDMFGHHEGYLTICVPAGRSERHPLGSWVTSFTYRRGDSEIGLARQLDWKRKQERFVARETLSYCAIVRNAESTILRSLMSVREVADEFVIALDRGTTDRTRQVLEQFRTQHAGHRRFEVIDADSPLDVGFDEARNRTVAAARGDWILWLDADEELIYPERLVKYLRNHQYDGLALAQHHLSADPVGVLTTDWPVRVFRNVPYLRFRGFVHEHPDDLEHLNSGPRSPAQIQDLHIMHHGYVTERVRRERFQRNLPLIQRDRQDNPDRMLGRMLWMRDLAHLCMFEIESNGGQITDSVMRYASEGIREWETLLAESDKPIAARMVRDGLEFYSTLVAMTGQGFDVAFQMHMSRSVPGPQMQAQVERGPKRGGRFLSREHLDKFLKICVDEQVVGFDNRYW